MDTGKALDKIQHANKIKMFNKGSMEGNIFRLIKEIWLEKKTKKQNNPILDLKRCFPPDVEKKKKKTIVIGSYYFYSIPCQKM